MIIILPLQLDNLFIFIVLVKQCSVLYVKVCTEPFSDRLPVLEFNWNLSAFFNNTYKNKSLLVPNLLWWSHKKQTSKALIYSQEEKKNIKPNHKRASTLTLFYFLAYILNKLVALVLYEYCLVLDHNLGITNCKVN